MKNVARPIALFALLAGAAFAAEPVLPFNGKDLTGWKAKPQGKSTSQWTVGTATLDPANPRLLKVAPGGSELVNNIPNQGHSLDFYSETRHGDAIIELEVMIPQGSNSGIYVQGEYEIQVLDSTGKEANPGPGDMGGIYKTKPPTNPVYKKPGEWNTFRIEFKAPKFDDKGAKTASAVFTKVELNGKVIHENVEVKGVTPGGIDGKEKPLGPLMFQGNHGPVAFRNIKITPVK